jgi:hypothetical protein
MLIQTRHHDKDTSASVVKTGYHDRGTGDTVAAPAIQDNVVQLRKPATMTMVQVLGLGYLASMTKVHRLQVRNMISR